MEESKKISFGFSKVTRKPIANSKPTLTKYNKIQLIDRLENQVIKTIEKPVVKIESPVAVPTEQNKFENFLTKSTVKVESVNGGKPESELTEDEIAARELLKEAQNISDGTVVLKPLMLPLATENLNDVQSTLEDYEDVPIEQFGMAMLKQMGWKEGEVVGKNKNKAAPPQVDANVQRRFGQMGLGCDISAKLNKTKNIKEEKDSKLVLKAGSFGKIVSGKYKSNYCEVQGFDIDNPDSIIVKLSLTGKCVTIPDIYIELVTREEYNKSSKVINIAKYEEYKIKSETITKKKRSSSCESDEDKLKASGSKSSKSDNSSRKRNYEDDIIDSKHKKRKTSSSDSEEEKYREKGSKRDDPTRRRDYEDNRRKRRKSSSDSEGEKYKQKSSKSSKKKKSKRDYEEKQKRKSSSVESDNEKLKSKRAKSSKYESKYKENKRYDSSEEDSKKYQKSHDKKKHKKHKRSHDSEDNPKHKDSGRHSKYSQDRQRSDKKYK